MSKYQYAIFGRNAGRTKVERWYRIGTDKITYVEKRVTDYRMVPMWKIGNLVVTMPLPGKLENSTIEDFHGAFALALLDLR